ncbi:(d)CMP kinase [candidate division WOR-3 bacterium]|uniref:Cytidylate kinase n=1 Tax=candidate division WOR-3 bacterium TaxID=2052148 RepID=A0A9D5K914_UNCW3|nr:(d)CMP kinase [candidate division WOR-3 bacterium]MBD3364591.1 (d)CMP kinase [candidate division WOR-3 bacterium]
MKFVVAIDGTASSGKSTTAKLLSKKLGFIHLDTGAMYRAVTYLLLGKQAEEASDDRLLRILRDSLLEFKIVSNALSINLDGKRLTDELRSPEVDNWVSPVSERGVVREYCVNRQREFGKDAKLVCEGRDIGSVVFPDAELKVFMKCDLAERVRRRKRELEEKGIRSGETEVKAGLVTRDRIDSGRELSPLIQVKDAMVVDTTDMTIDEQVKIIYDEVIKRMGNGPEAGR